MRCKVIAVVVAALGFGAGLQAQTMVEYGHVATQSSAKALSATSRATNVAADKMAKQLDAAGKSAGPIAPSTSPNVVAVADKSPQPVPAATVKPAAPTAVFILTSGERIESSNYVITVQSLEVEQNGSPRTIRVSDLNVPATTAANQQRGIALKIPTSKSQIMVSFQ